MEYLLNDKSRAVGAALCILVLAVACFFLLYKLGSEPFQDYDEATYAEIMTESLASHHYLSFTFLDNAYFNKPPLLFWLMDASREVIPDVEFAARFPSALSGIVLIGTVMLAVWYTTSGGYAAAFSGGVLLATSAFIEPARQARFDILVSLFVVLSVYAFLRAQDNRQWFLWFGAFVGLGILAKGPIEGFGIIGALAVAVAYRRWKWLLDPYFWGGVGTALLIALPWHLYETAKFGMAFWDTYLIGQVLNRVATPLFTTGPTNAEYIGYLFQFATPWALAFCVSFVLTPLTWMKLRLQESALLFASEICVFAVLAVCLLTKTKAISYLIPLYPFMAVVIALSVAGLTRFQIPFLKPFLKPILVVLCVVGLGYGLWLSYYNGFHISGYYASEIALAEEEQTIGDTLLARHAPTFYIYDTTTLGSIMFYSRLVKPEWIGDGDVPPGSYLLYQTNELQKLETSYPQLHLASVYQGESLSLAEVD